MSENSEQVLVKLMPNRRARKRLQSLLGDTWPAEYWSLDRKGHFIWVDADLAEQAIVIPGVSRTVDRDDLLRCF